jgi:hypothetical protein
LFPDCAALHPGYGALDQEALPYRFGSRSKLGNPSGI